jgi:hypothetical protein
MRVDVPVRRQTIQHCARGEVVSFGAGPTSGRKFVTTPHILIVDADISRSNWLFAGSLRAGQRAAAIMSLIRSAQLNGHDPYVYLKDVLTRLPTHRADDIAALLPHRWTLSAS